MYPNQQFMRGKVRDLPDSGVIYLNRIKPIGQVFQEPQGSVAEVEMTVENIPKPHKAPSSFERYNSEEERAPTRPPTTTTTTTTTAAPIPTEPPVIFERKISEPKKALQKTKPSQLTVPEQAELDMLLDDLIKNENVQKPTPKIGRSGSKKHMGAIPPRVISFDGTARVDKPRARAFGSPVSVRLQPRKLYSVGSSASQRNQGADFDPWERMGQ
ncbi:unnamed protein product [Caenorhabditis sp. 36 PRJEB53466]|nr:unnamed protein product [Caenorhabditis sp. 36 PRJEB53466]